MGTVLWICNTLLGEFSNGFKETREERNYCGWKFPFPRNCQPLFTLTSTGVKKL